jgi:hypothetical protein
MKTKLALCFIQYYHFTVLSLEVYLHNKHNKPKHKRNIPSRQNKYQLLWQQRPQFTLPCTSVYTKNSRIGADYSSCSKTKIRNALPFSFCGTPSYIVWAPLLMRILQAIQVTTLSRIKTCIRIPHTSMFMRLLQASQVTTTSC